MAEPTVLSTRALNRATLARQLLLAREKLTAVKAVERLAGLQAQLARPPYLALWSRVHGFARAQLTRDVLARKLVRGTLMRGTIHLVSAADYQRWRATIQPVLDRGLKSVLGDRLAKVDLAAVHAEATALFTRAPAGFDELRQQLIARFPKADERAMGYVVRLTLPLVMAPDADSDWGYHGQAGFTLAESWLGAPIARTADGAELVLRYLAAFGPASVADAQTWSGLQGLKPTFEALRAKLRTFRDDRGRELFDLPKAPRPDADTPAPPRLLPDFDNLLLGHDDRRRVIADEHRSAVATKNLLIPATFLVDGVVAGRWRLERKKQTATLELTPFGKLARPARDALAAEATELARFVEPDAATHTVSFT